MFSYVPDAIRAGYQLLALLGRWGGRREPPARPLGDLIAPEMFERYKETDMGSVIFKKHQPPPEPLMETYDIPRYDALVERTFEKIKELSVVKGGEYAGDVDRLANFRRNAEAAGVTMEQCWQIYAGKHWDAITQYIRDDAAGKERKRAEPLEGRVDDLIVYLLLFKAMLDEKKGELLLGGTAKSKPHNALPVAIWTGNTPVRGDVVTLADPSSGEWLVERVHGREIYLTKGPCCSIVDLLPDNPVEAWGLVSRQPAIRPTS